MNDHNLDDLIIDNIKPKSAKTKNILTIVALLIVLLIVAIVLTSVVLDNPKEDSTILETNDTEMVSPELTLQNATQPKKEKSEPKLNEIIDEKLSQPAVKTKAVKSIAVPVKDNVNKKVEITKKFDQTPVTAKARSLPEQTLASKNKPSEKTAPASVKSKPVASGITYYIQVGSYKGSPSKRFLQIIKNNGFKYKITSPAANGTKKLLIGSYASRSAVDTALIRVRDLINKSAFVVKK